MSGIVEQGVAWNELRPVLNPERGAEMGATAPLIGVTTSRRRKTAGLSFYGESEAYTSALLQAGACPVLIPLGLPDERMDELVRRIDGLLFTGGGDIHPQRYGSQLHPKVHSVDEERDGQEIRLVHDLLSLGKPFLGICRGLQVLNVALGGSLYEDLLDQYPGSLQHDYSNDHQRDYLAHWVEITADTLLNRIVGEKRLQVNSLHHQGVRQLAPGLQVSAVASDGLVEGVELPGYAFGVAVQWHPECLTHQESARRLFAAFIDAAGGESR